MQSSFTPLRLVALASLVAICSSALTATIFLTVGNAGETKNLFSADLTPSKDDAYNLGTSNLRWKSIQLGPGTLFMQDQVTGKQVALTVSQGALQIGGATSVRVGATQLTSEGILFPDGSLLQSGTSPSGNPNYTAQNICVETVNSEISLGTCESLNVSGYDKTLMMSK
jgi:hypothetical protein